MVLVHGAASLALLAWAFGVYTQRIKWTSPEKAEPGVFDQHKARADELNSGIDKAYTRWSGNLLTVQSLDTERFSRRSFYPGQLALLKTGKFNGMDVPKPVQKLVDAPNGYLNITQPINRESIDVGGVALRSIDTYNQDLAKQFVDFEMSQKRSREHYANREALNKKIIGTDGPPPEKGLRTQLTEQRNMEDAATNQERYDMTYLVNLEAEFGLLKKRRDALTARMKELTGPKKDEKGGQ